MPRTSSARLCFTISALLSTALSTSLAAQQVHVVDGAGGGDFTQLAPAVAAAASGDVILVRPGTYFSVFGQLTLDGKDLTLLGDGSPPPQIDPLVVRNLAAGQRVLLRGLAIGPSVAGFGWPAVRAHDNAGVTWIEDCTLVGDDGVPGIGVPSTDGYPALSADTDAGVIVVRSALRGGDGLTTANPPFGVHDHSAGGPAVRAVGSRIAFSDVSLLGGSGGSDPVGGLDGERGGDGLEADECELFLSDVDAQGGPGGDGCSAAIPDACQGGDGLHLDTSNVVHRLASTSAGGAGGLLDGGGSAFDGLDVDSTAGDVVVSLPGAARSIELSSPVRELELGTITYRGVQGDTFGLFLAVPAGYLPLLGKQGVYALGFPLLGPLLVWTVTSPDGVFQVPFEGWELTPSGIEGLPVHFQCFLKDGGGTTLLSGPGSLVTVGAAF